MLRSFVRRRVYSSGVSFKGLEGSSVRQSAGCRFSASKLAVAVFVVGSQVPPASNAEPTQQAPTAEASADQEIWKGVRYGLIGSLQGCFLGIMASLNILQGCCQRLEFGLTC